MTLNLANEADYVVMMINQPQCPSRQKQVIHFLETSGNTTSPEEKDILVSELKINENETAILTFMIDQRHITLLSLLCITIVSDTILYDMIKKAIFNKSDIQSILLSKVKITKSKAPEYILDLK